MLDKDTLFSDEQAITATAVSTNVVDLGANRNIGVGEPVALMHRVVEDFDNLDNLDIEIQTANNEAFNDGNETLLTTTLALADLVAGATSPIITLPRGVKRFLRLRYVVDGSNPSEGKITAGLASDAHDWKVYPAVTGGAG